MLTSEKHYWINRTGGRNVTRVIIKFTLRRVSRMSIEPLSFPLFAEVMIVVDSCSCRVGVTVCDMSNKLETSELQRGH